MDRIKNWFSNLGSKIESFMYGRYGYDELSQALSIVALICLIVGLVTSLGVFSVIALVLYCYALFRMYSKNISKRQLERESWLRFTGKIKSWFSLRRKMFAERNTHSYVKCPQCKTSLRVPKGKGKIKIRCPKCGNEIVKKT